MGEGFFFTSITLLTTFMVYVKQKPIGAIVFLLWVCQRRTVELAPPGHKTLFAVFSKMPPKMERNMYKKCPLGREGYAILLWNLLSEKITSQEASVITWTPYGWIEIRYKTCSQVHTFLNFLQCRVACFFASMTSLSAVSLATDPHSAPSPLPSALKALFCLLSLPSEGSYLAARMQMKLLDLVEGIRWH